MALTLRNIIYQALCLLVLCILHIRKTHNRTRTLVKLINAFGSTTTKQRCCSSYCRVFEPKILLKLFVFEFTCVRDSLMVYKYTNSYSTLNTHTAYLHIIRTEKNLISSPSGSAVKILWCALVVWIIAVGCIHHSLALTFGLFNGTLKYVL